MKSTHRRSTSNKESRSPSKVGAPITMDELAEHVSHEYTHGPGSMLRNLERKRSRCGRQYQFAQLEREQSLESQNESVPDCVNAVENLDSRPALVLNADFQPLSYLPLSMWHWQEALKAVFNGKVRVVDVYPDAVIRTSRLRVPLPSVIALTEYVSTQFLHNKPAFTKRNVFLRDVSRMPVILL